MNSIKKLLNTSKYLAVVMLLVNAPAVMSATYEDGKVVYEDINASVIAIAESPKTILGQNFSYPVGEPLIKAYEIEIPVGRQTSLHKHSVPLFAYVISGVLEVDYGSKGKRTIKAGTSFIEAINWCHLGKAVGTQPVKLIGVYLGQKSPDQIKPDECAKPD
ncbi:cupin domain-containing protein [Polynucleobacter antarcticus]|uniref:Cupin type-2 domain-containing protein n=1 Tax=Polynucleobacter antarcticus TaxID=1743162 RepID=A0A6M9Q4P8_9BURK|nr:cupin domain-containing protein [Polynucleobacter antarcticus]QKM63513.1 hypothetical protein DCO16_10965 [Polynucleobacter antarcticus]